MVNDELWDSQMVYPWGGGTLDYGAARWMVQRGQWTMGEPNGLSFGMMDHGTAKWIVKEGLWTMGQPDGLSKWDK